MFPHSVAFGKNCFNGGGECKTIQHVQWPNKEKHIQTMESTIKYINGSKLYTNIRVIKYFGGKYISCNFTKKNVGIYFKCLVFI